MLTAATAEAWPAAPVTSTVAWAPASFPSTVREVDSVAPPTSAFFSVTVHEPVGTSVISLVLPAATVTSTGEEATPVALSVQVYSKVNSWGASAAPSPSTVLVMEKPPVRRV